MVQKGDLDGMSRSCMEELGWAGPQHLLVSVGTGLDPIRLGCSPTVSQKNQGMNLVGDLLASPGGLQNLLVCWKAGVGGTPGQEGHGTH